MAVVDNIKKALTPYPRAYGTAQFIKHFPLHIREALTPYSVRKYPEGLAFNGDPFFKSIVEKLPNYFPITSCVETGTYKGDSTLFLSSIFPGHPVYTIELNGRNFRESKWRFRRSSNIVLIRGNSPVKVGELISQNKVGDIPFFFLDAHWNLYWPLLAELEKISALEKAIVAIHDFKVPDRPEYGFDHYEENINDLGYIKDAIQTGYKIVFPKYSEHEAKEKGYGPLRGYVFLFKNIPPAQFSAFMEDPFVKGHFNEHILLRA